MLLDLLGAPSPRIHSYYRDTDWLHAQLKSADQRLRTARLVEVEDGDEGWFQDWRMHKGMIGDDHTPVSLRRSWTYLREVAKRSFSLGA